MTIMIIRITSVICLLKLIHAYAPLQLITETAEWCRYKFYVSSIGWAEAFNQCEQNNQSLARITGSSEHNLVASLIASSMSEMAGTYTIQDTFWIGLHAAGSVYNSQYRWDNCEPYSVDSSRWDDTGEGTGNCVVYNTTSQKYQAAPCAGNKQFLCENINTGLASCYTYVSSVLPSYFAQLTISTPFANCYQSCISTCVAVQWKDNSDCVHMGRTSTGGTIGRTGMYTKGVIDFKDLATASVNFSPGDICSPTPEETTISPTATIEIMSTTYLKEPSYSTAPDSETTFTWTPSLPFSSGVINTSPTDFSSFVASSNTIQYSSTDTSIATTESSVVTSLSIPGTPALATTTTTTSPTCYCPCETVAVSNVTLTQDQLLQVIEELKTALSVDKKELSSYKRKLTSASDERTSAKSIGYVGAAILICVFSTLVIFDAPRIFSDTKRFIRNFCSCCFHKKYPIRPDR